MRLRAWLRIVHCYIFSVLTVPEAINLATLSLSREGLVAEALGVSRNLRMLPALRAD
jgi:hypothetical protein